MSTIKKCYKRMYELLIENKLFKQGEYFNRKQLATKLYNKDLLNQFELIYKIDCNCSGTWSFFDFSDRFGRFVKALEDIKYCKRYDNKNFIII